MAAPAASDCGKGSNALQTARGGAPVRVCRQQVQVSLFERAQKSAVTAGSVVRRHRRASPYGDSELGRSEGNCKSRLLRGDGQSRICDLAWSLTGDQAGSGSRRLLVRPLESCRAGSQFLMLRFDTRFITY